MNTVEESPLSPPDLELFEQRLNHLQAQLSDLKELIRLDQLPPDQWADMQQQMTDLEARMQTYLGQLSSPPMVFWQVVRFGGLGLLIGIALQRWLLG